MSDVSSALRAIDAVIAAGPFDATWESLEDYTIPRWYKDAKFGIFSHWGVYSVPGVGNEWYARRMYLAEDSVFAHHVDAYGPQTENGYKDLIPKLTAENYDPEAWADLFEALQEAGFSPVACAAVHSENERDQVKRGIRSCTLDLLLELAPEQGPTQVAVLLPGEGPEAGFLERVAAWFERIGALEDGWRAELSRELRSSAFLG